MAKDDVALQLEQRFRRRWRKRMQEIDKAKAQGRPWKAIVLERFEPGHHAFLASVGDVQVGWCQKGYGGWYVLDMDWEILAGPIRTLRAAAEAGEQVLAHEAGAGNPGW